MPSLIRPHEPPQAKALGVFGGSFDPVHRGHVGVARAALLAHGLDEVLFIPAAESPHKRGRGLASAEDRVAMLELALASEERMRVATLELERGGVSWTIETLQQLAEPGVRLHLILGSDNLKGLPTWKDIELIFELAELVVVLRSDQATDQLAQAVQALGPDLGAQLKQGFCEVEPMPGESSAIRSQLFQGQQDSGPLDEGVQAYIADRGLYGAGGP